MKTKFFSHSFKKFSSTEIVKIDYKHLIESNFNSKHLIQEAFGINGNGVIIIKNIPGLLEARNRVLRNTFKLYNEPEDVLKSLSKPEVKDPIGWYEKKFYDKNISTNTDKFKSFFARYPRETVTYPQNPQLETDSCNVWPTTIPNFKSDFLEINKIIVGTVHGLLRQMDYYLEDKLPNYQNYFYKNFLENYVNANRLIVYEPLENFNHENIDKDSWDFWHTDNGLFTCLTHPIYINKFKEEFNLPYSCLWFKDRSGKIKEAHFNYDELLVQAGDSLFILSGGNVPTTPHCVLSNGKIPRDLFRLNLASFFEPNYNYVMRIPNDMTYANIIEKDPAKFLYRSVDDFRNGCNFKEFIDSFLNKFSFK